MPSAKHSLADIERHLTSLLATSQQTGVPILMQLQDGDGEIFALQQVIDQIAQQGRLALRYAPARRSGDGYAAGPVVGKRLFETGLDEQEALRITANGVTGYDEDGEAIVLKLTRKMRPRFTDE